MGSPLEHRHGLYDVSPELRRSHPLADLLNLPSQTAAPILAEPPALKPKTPKRRVRVWELNTNLHCSVIGTCLSHAELRRILARLKIAGIETADEHELHMLGVLLANRPQEGGKMLQKALDRRHDVAINQFAKARDDAGIGALWQKAIAGGDIPGAYWAVLTHPESSDKMVQKAFGDVHMLSHLMGATNCADLQRMRKLEDELAVATDKLDRQQRQLRDGFVERDEKISRLSVMLAEKVQSQVTASLTGSETEASSLRDTIAELNDRLARETARRERLDQRLAALEEADTVRRKAEAERDALRRELEAVEHQMDALIGLADAEPAATARLDGATILYVGGRTGQVPRLRALVERAGGQLLHHDGGIEDAAAMLPGFVSRSDLTVFPVDCVSHNAMAQAKRACQQLNKPFVPLRTSSLACLLSALSGMNRPAVGF
ncbi:MAG: DUF2325 domain-containing protein [Xanthobacteraceae bacterium]|nr:DUF2325 domain-containing protein [Xanthobacteraceae bacterium]